jgi:hypothetical protein
MAGDFAALAQRKADLVRKTLTGSVFVDDITSPLLGSITALSTGVVELSLMSNATVPAAITTMKDLGLLDDTGAAFGGDVTESTVTSWGEIEPTRTDVTSDTTTLAVVAQETKAVTLGLYLGQAGIANLVPDPDTGEVSFTKSTSPTVDYRRVLALGVDKSNAGEIYIARYLPRAKSSREPTQTFQSGDGSLTYGFNFTSSVDQVAGYSEKWFFGGPGWLAIIDELGFASA